MLMRSDSTVRFQRRPLQAGESIQVGQPDGCGSKTGKPQNGTLANENKDENLRSPNGLTLTHTQVVGLVWSSMRPSMQQASQVTPLC